MRDKSLIRLRRRRPILIHRYYRGYSIVKGADEGPLFCPPSSFLKITHEASAPARRRRPARDAVVGKVNNRWIRPLPRSKIPYPVSTSSRMAGLAAAAATILQRQCSSDEHVDDQTVDDERPPILPSIVKLGGQCALHCP